MIVVKKISSLGFKYQIIIAIYKVVTADGIITASKEGLPSTEIK